MFFGAENSQLCQTFPEMHKFQSRKSLLRCLLPAFEAPGHLHHRRPPQRLWTATAPQPRRSRCTPPSAAAWSLRRFCPETRLAAVASGGRGRRGRCAVGGRRNLWACGALDPVNQQRNDECFGLQAKYMYKHSRHLFYNITFTEMMCKTCFNEEASKDNVISAS